MRILDASLSALVLFILCSSLPARAQQSQIPTPPPPALPGVNPNPGPEPDPTLHHMTEQMSLQRNAQRQQQIVSDTARLLQLAQKLNADVSKTDKNMLSVPVVKEADQIEKLAKAIKNKMRDAQ
jgi:hypothetical protein